MKLIKNPATSKASATDKLKKNALILTKLYFAILLSLSIGMFYSCASDNILQKKPTNVTEKKPSPENSTVSVKSNSTEKSSSTSKESDLTSKENSSTSKKSKAISKRKAKKINKKSNGLSEVVKAYQAGEFNEVIALTENTDDSESLYYRAMTRFAMLSYNHKFNPQTITSYREEILDLLPQVIESSTGEIQARARLWYGVAIDLNYTDLASKKRAVTLFYQVRQDEEHREKLYNEARLYTGNLYTRIGYYTQARAHYRALLNTPYPKDPVYDYHARKFVTVEEAVENAYNRLKLYVDGQHPSYKPVRTEAN